MNCQADNPAAGSAAVCCVSVLVAALLLAGCGSAGSQPGANIETSPKGDAPAFAEADAAKALAPENAPDSGSLTGVLLLRRGGDLQPVIDVKVALGKILSDDEGTERVVAYEPSRAPVAQTDSTGRFVFENLQSGRYGLILDTVLNAVLLYRDGAASAILLEVTAGEVTDLGRLEFSDLPLPASLR